MELLTELLMVLCHLLTCATLLSTLCHRPLPLVPALFEALDSALLTALVACPANMSMCACH
jgi:hypothetical protein